MRRFILLALLAGSLAFAPACHNPTSGDILGLQVTSPPAGQTYAINDTVIISWSCAGCYQIYGSSGVVIGVVSEASGTATNIGNGAFIGSAPWPAGQTPSGTILPTGSYHVAVSTFPDYTATAKSPSFQLAAAR